MNLVPPRFMSRRASTRLAVLLLAVLLVGSACSSGSDPSEGVQGLDRATATDDPGPSAPGEPESTVVGTDSGPTASELIEELPPAGVGFPTATDQDQPVWVTIESLGIDQAPIIDVGVEVNGDMEVPPADQVGWYRYSPLPGLDGSSILAAHIAFNGRNGVFVRLADIEVGAEVAVADETGQIQRFRVDSVERYGKEQLPEDVVYARTGPSRLVLVTCGGRFDTARNSYDDNVVVVATPIAS